MPFCLPFKLGRGSSSSSSGGRCRDGAHGPLSSAQALTHANAHAPDGTVASSLARFRELSLQSHAHTACCTFEPLPAYSGPGAAASLRLDDDDKSAISPGLSELLDQAVGSVEDEIKRIDGELRELSLKMWDFKEIMWEERKTHELFVEYLGKQKGWKVTPHAYGLETAFEATFEHSGADKPAKVPFVGFNSELDALPGIGHACGHNIIAIGGVAAAMGLAAALEKHDISARISLLGTPAEEGGGGKVAMLKAGAYEGLDACFMIHPSPADGAGIMIAVQPVVVKYKGVTAHSGAGPWLGVNALDAAVLAYTNISALRQQIRPDQRVHGIIQGHNLAPNVVPDDTTMIFNIRSPDLASLKVLVGRVQKCFEAGALATGCKMEVEWGATYADVRQSEPLRIEYTRFMKKKFDKEISTEPFLASTDFGNITQALPGLHPWYAIALKDPAKEGNHTVGFASAARTEEAHERTKEAALGIAAVAARIVLDADFLKATKKEFDEWKRRNDSA